MLDLAALRETALSTLPLLEANEETRPHLHSHFKNWPLSVAAYNCGEGRLRTVMSRHKAKTFEAISPRMIEPSVIVIKLGDADLSAGVVFRTAEPYEVNETYPWYGDFSTATNQCRGARITLEHDLSFVPYVLEVRAFNDGVAYRHVIPGEEAVARVPDEYSTFVLPAGSTAWYAGLAAGHYEGAPPRSGGIHSAWRSAPVAGSSRGSHATD